MGDQVEPDAVELAKLQDALHSCRRELAQRHHEIETLHEERHEILRRCETAEEEARALSATLEELRASSDQAGPGRLRLRRGRK